LTKGDIDQGHVLIDEPALLADLTPSLSFIFTFLLSAMYKLSHQTIHRIKLMMHGTFIAVIAIAFLLRAVASIPGDWLFFFTSNAVENFIGAFIVYVLYYFVFKSSASWRKILFVILFLTILLGMALLKDYRIHRDVTVEQTFEYFTSFLGKALLFYLLVFIINRFEYLQKYLTLERELNRAKEQLLRNQLNPHFLFNTFNSLYSLALKNHPNTPEYILKLSGMMRYLTDETQLHKVPLLREIDFIEKYLAIEKIRFGNDARIQLNMEGLNKEQIMIEPFLLITLVENAFKHGFYTNIKDAFVKISVVLKGNELSCSVENSVFIKQHFQKSDREGKGLENLRTRLRLLYPNHSRLKITEAANTYTAHLSIKLEK
jgi:two-component system LytT family sensor kinase